jgi:anti-sigma-K factor RskA
VGQDNGTTGDEPADDAGDAQGSGGIDASVIRWALVAAAIVAVLAFALMTLSRRG